MRCAPSATWNSRLAASAALAAWLAWAASAAPGCGSAPEADGPDLVLVTLDTLRVDHVGVHGGRGELTPHLDALARRGLVHDAAYTPMPTTAPAHVSLFTGLAPSEHGAVANGRPMHPSHAEREVARRLRRAGYATGAFVTTRLLAAPATGLTGFETYDAPRAPTRPGAEAVDAALRWVSVVGDRPILLWVHLYDPHAPYGPAAHKEPLRAGEYGWVDPQRYEEPVSRRRMAAYYATGVRDADRALGTLLEGLDRQRDRPRLVVVASDHGEALDEHLEARGYAYDHGEFLDREQVQVVLVLAGEGVTPGRSPGTVSLADLHATLLRAAGAEGAEPGARDLRSISAAPRRVAIERRPFTEAELPASGARAALVRGHAAAAAEGEQLVVVGEDGSAAQPDGADPALLETARAALAARAAEAAAPRDLDPELREALRSLGYAE